MVLRLSIVFLCCSLAVQGKETSDCPTIKRFFSDFDGTITKQDSTVLVVRSSEEYRLGSHGDRKVINDTWKSLMARMEKQEKKSFDRIFNSVLSRRLSSKELERALVTLNSFYLRMYKIGQVLGFFDGVEKHSIMQYASKIKFVDKSIKVLKTFGSVTRIVSNNLSKFLIWAALQGYVSSDHIFANQVFHKENISDALQDTTMMGSSSKRDVVLKELSQAQGAGLSVYVGDGVNDFLAMMEVDVPILINADHNTKRLAVKFGIVLKPLANASLKVIKEQKERTTKVSSPVLYVTTSWKTIGDVLECKPIS